jgi:hypothetical protein
MIGAGAQLHLLHGGFEQVRARLVQLAELADFGGSHVRVGLEAGFSEAVSLEGAGLFDPCPDVGAGFAGAGTTEFVEGDAGDFDAQAYRSGPSGGWVFSRLRVGFDHRDGAGAFLLRVAVETAGAGVHAGDEDEVGRVVGNILTLAYRLVINRSCGSSINSHT